MSISQRITARAEFERAAKELADAVDQYLDAPLSTPLQFDVIDALAAYRNAEGALWVSA